MRKRQDSFNNRLCFERHSIPRNLEEVISSNANP